MGPGNLQQKTLKRKMNLFNVCLIRVGGTSLKNSQQKTFN